MYAQDAYGLLFCKIEYLKVFIIQNSKLDCSPHRFQDWSKRSDPNAGSNAHYNIILKHILQWTTPSFTNKYVEYRYYLMQRVIPSFVSEILKKKPFSLLSVHACCVLLNFLLLDYHHWWHNLHQLLYPVNSEAPLSRKRETIETECPFIVCFSCTGQELNLQCLKSQKGHPLLAWNNSWLIALIQSAWIV